MQNKVKTVVYVGTYTENNASKGIYIFSFDKATGKLEYADTVKSMENPTFIAISQDGRYLYSSNTVLEGGSISAYAIDHNNGQLTFLNRKSSMGSKPCHLVVDKTGKHVLSANFGSGSICVHPILADGSLGEPADFKQHEGSSVHPVRQTSPHAHSINLDPANRFAVAADLGIDKVMIYQFDDDTGKLSAGSQPFAMVPASSGPRHFDFHPSGKYAYLINEIGNTIIMFNYSEAEGKLKAVQTVSTLPEDFDAQGSAAHIQVDKNGKYLYGSNRGHESMVIYSIDTNTGMLEYVGHESTQGIGPRGFSLDSDGNFLIVANQGSNNMVVFKVDNETGKLTPTGNTAEVPCPVCVKFLDLNP